MPHNLTLLYSQGVPIGYMAVMLAILASMGGVHNVL